MCLVAGRVRGSRSRAMILSRSRVEGTGLGGRGSRDMVPYRSR